jgi:hypothetical protein
LQLEKSCPVCHESQANNVFKKVCKKVLFFAGISQKPSLIGETEPEKGPDCPCKDTLPKGAKKGGYSLSSDGDTGSPVPLSEIYDKSSVLTGRDLRGIYMPLARISRTESCRIRKNCHFPVLRPDPEFPGGYT